MFAALQFERAPVELQDLGTGVVTWIQDTGGFAAVGLLIWLIAHVARRRPAGVGEGPPRSDVTRYLFMALVAVSAGAYGWVLASRIPDLLTWLTSDTGSSSTSLALLGEAPLENRLLTIGSAAAIAAASFALVLDFLKLRWRRIWALSKLSFKEAIRRKVLWVFTSLLVVFLFGSWFLPYEELKPEDQVRNYVSVVYWAMTPLLLLVASLLAAFSIPTDIRQQTIHTILTKPVERFEIVLGRFIGYTLLMSLVLAVLTAFSLVYVARGVDPEAAAESLKARVPLYGDLEFEEAGERKQKGENVGREWDYRSYISGPMGPGTKGPNYAVWDFKEVPSYLADRDRVRCEFNFDIYRTTKGEENKGVFCTFTVRTWNSSPDPKFPERFVQEREKERRNPGQRTAADIDNELAEKYGYYVSPTKEVVNNHTLFLDLPVGLIRNAVRTQPQKAKGGEGTGADRPPLEIRVLCVSRTQFLGMAKHDLYVRLDEPDSRREPWLFAVNFFKASVGLWLRLCLVIGLAVACSTYLNGPISWLVTIFLFTAGFFRDFVQTLGAGTNYGGGPTKAFMDILQRKSPLTETDPTTITQVASGSDEVFRWVVRRFINVLPDVDRFDFSDKLREGFDISGGQLFVSLILLAGYLLPWAVLSYYLIKSREIASS